MQLQGCIIQQDKWQEFIQLGPSDLSFIKKLLDIYISNTRILIGHMYNQLKYANHVNMHIHIHMIKGSSLNMGITAMSDCMKTYEAKIQDNKYALKITDLEHMEDLLVMVENFRATL